MHAFVRGRSHPALGSLHRPIVYVLVLSVVLVVSFPLIWMVLSSFKPAPELYRSPPTVLPTRWTLSNYFEIFTTTSFPTYFRNSVIVALGSTFSSLIVGSLGAYSLSRFRYMGISTFAKSVLLAYMLPSVLLVLPLFIIMLHLGLTNSLLGLIVANTTFTLPFSLWFMRSYFRAIPLELEESAMMDGRGRLRVLVEITLPLSLPGLVTVGLFVFAHSWNEFLFALVFNSSDDKKTLPVGLATLVGQDTLYSWGALLAGAVMVTLPVIVLYGFLQRHIIAGAADGGLKG